MLSIISQIDNFSNTTSFIGFYSFRPVSRGRRRTRASYSQGGAGVDWSIHRQQNRPENGVHLLLGSAKPTRQIVCFFAAWNSIFHPIRWIRTEAQKVARCLCHLKICDGTRPNWKLETTQFESFRIPAKCQINRVYSFSGNLSSEESSRISTDRRLPFQTYPGIRRILGL